MRPYMSYLTDELKEVAGQNWSDIAVLTAIHAELQYRFRTKAIQFKTVIEQRLKQLDITTLQREVAALRTANRTLKLENAALKLKIAEQELAAVPWRPPGPTIAAARRL